MSIQVVDFFERTWEKEVKHIKACKDRKTGEIFETLFPKSFLSDFSQNLEFGVDCVGARFRDGVRETLSTMIEGQTSFDMVLQQGWTLQLHQPQRFNDNLWRLISSLEAEFGSLVGCNAYITPGDGSQGLAPHYDDVSIFCCQVYGTKNWSIHRANPCLANHPSGDLEGSTLGKPYMEVQLEPGDILYLPRGTIHQASTNDSQSTHLTISFLQNWAYVDLLAKSLEACTVLPPLQLPLPDSLKKSFHSIDNVAVLMSNLSKCCEDLISYVNSKAGIDMVTNGLNAMKFDFMQHRLPPHPAQIIDKGPIPSINDEIVLLGNFFHVFKDLSGDMKTESRGDGSVDVSFGDGYDFRVMSSVYNSRKHHMMPSGSEDCCAQGTCEHPHSHASETSGSEDHDDSKDNDDSEEYDSSEEDEEEQDQSSMLLPQCFESVLQQVFSGTPVRVIDLIIDHDQRKIDIARTFHDFGLCRTIPKGSKKRKH